MARLIDAEKVWKKAQRTYSDLVLLHVIQNTLDATETVDAVEVVRCGECLFCNSEICPMSGTPGRVSASDFCSYGERRSDNAAD